MAQTRGSDRNPGHGMEMCLRRETFRLSTLPAVGGQAGSALLL